MYYRDGAYHSAPEPPRGRDRRDAMRDARFPGDPADPEVIRAFAESLGMTASQVERYTARELRYEARREQRGGSSGRAMFGG